MLCTGRGASSAGKDPSCGQDGALRGGQAWAAGSASLQGGRAGPAAGDSRGRELGEGAVNVVLGVGFSLRSHGQQGLASEEAIQAKLGFLVHQQGMMKEFGHSLGLLKQINCSVPSAG